jgi:hypothetical protein
MRSVTPPSALVTAIGRKKLGFSHPKLKEALHRDFGDCSALAEVLCEFSVSMHDRV